MTPVHAARLHEHGAPLVVEEVQLTDPGPDEVRVRLQFAGVNPIDRYIALGRVAPDAPLPRTLGGEAAGTLDRAPVLVAGEGLGSARDGLWATEANVPRPAVVPIPDGIAPRAAAAMGIAGLTACQCVRELARIGPQDRVLVLGASGGVGSMIVSLARAAGATVWGQTGSGAKAAQIRELGAAEVLVGGPQALGQRLADWQPTVALDPLGGEFVAPVIAALAPRGRLVSYGVSAGAEVTFDMQQLYRKMITVFGYGGMQLTREERRPGLEAALTALGAGELEVRVDSVLPLTDVNEAFARLTERRVQGKLLLGLD
ncbi:MAG TPA: zinc-binding alcohol dehydrogenase family protein [Solirubrobacteraceae bacterium]|nr:zinc-binding alcohol dehydrogenase family protein [Solirubrobacteraceae bacterium]